MRRKIFAVLLVLTTLLCGCSRNAIESQTDSTESTAEITAETLESESSLFSSESNQTEAPKESTALETEKAQPTMPETLPDVPEQTVSQVQTAPSATESPAEETRKPVAPEKPQEIPKPAETEPQPAPEAPEETKPKSAYDFEFDMEAIKADCIDIGKGMGLDRYRYAIDSLQAQKIYKKYSDMIDERYESLDEADKKTVWYKLTEKAKECRIWERIDVMMRLVITCVKILIKRN